MGGEGLRKVLVPSGKFFQICPLFLPAILARASPIFENAIKDGVAVCAAAAILTMNRRLPVPARDRSCVKTLLCAASRVSRVCVVDKQPWGSLHTSTRPATFFLV